MNRFVDLLSTGPGTFVYHLMILLAMLSAAGIAYIEYRRTRNPDQYHFLWAFSVLLLLRIPLLIGSPFRPELAEGVLPLLLSAIIPLLVYALEVSSLTLLWWAFLSPLIGRRTSRVFLIGNLVLAAVVTVALFPSWYRMLQPFPLLEYATFWQQAIWDLWATLLSLSAAALLFVYRRRLGYIFPAISFTFLTVGNLLILFHLVGLGRLVNLIGYPLLVMAIYRAALQDLYAYRQELETLSEESLRQTRDLLFLVEVSRALGESLNLNTVLRNVAESVTHALDADRTAVLLRDEDPRQLRLATQFVPLQRAGEELLTTPFSLSEQPLLDHVVRRRKQVVLNPQMNPSRLRALYDLLGSQEQGPIIIQPLVHHQRVLGVLIVGRDRSKRPFGAGEAKLCASVAPQVAAAVENARLYQRLAAALQIQEEETGRREAILESIAEGIIVTNAKGCAVLVNAAAEKILGVARERVLGQPLQRLLESAAADREADLHHLQELTTPLHVLFELQNQQVQVSAAPVRSQDGDTLGIVAALRDVTREVQAERAKREFVAVISHELRTPLTAILGYTEALYSGMVGNLTQTQSQFIRTIHGNARRMVAMADNLIALSAAERGHLQLEYAETDLALIIGAVVQTFVPQMRAGQLEWSMDIEDDLPLIEADPNRIRQVLMNLMSNAIKFTFPGGRIAIGGATVRDPQGSEPHYCRLWVQDTGIGIPPEKQLAIWERFSRAEGPVEEKGSGLGLGLTIVKSLTEAHGGRVWVKSTPGEGSTFTLLLPIQQPSHSLLETGVAYPDMDEAVAPLGSV